MIMQILFWKTGACEELAILTLLLKMDIGLHIFPFCSITHTTNCIQPH